MCGRYTLLEDAQTFAKEFGLTEPISFVARYNIAPTQEVPIVRLRAEASPLEMKVVRAGESGVGRRCDVLRWGLIPSWAKDAKIAYSTINARGETVATQPAFRDAFRKRRCIVPASGFFEWQPVMENGKEVKQPFYVRRKDGRPLALAGLWERWVGPGQEVIESFTIITTTANSFLSHLHDRMPVILDRDSYDAWLNPDTGLDELKSLLAPCSPNLLEMVPVSRKVNSPKNDEPECIKPV